MELFASLGLALAAGLLIGLQREQSASAEPDGRRGFVSGARTYPLVALLLTFVLGGAGRERGAV